MKKLTCHGGLGWDSLIVVDVWAASALRSQSIIPGLHYIRTFRTRSVTTKNSQGCIAWLYCVHVCSQVFQTIFFFCFLFVKTSYTVGGLLLLNKIQTQPPQLQIKISFLIILNLLQTLYQFWWKIDSWQPKLQCYKLRDETTISVKLEDLLVPY